MTVNVKSSELTTLGDWQSAAKKVFGRRSCWKACIRQALDKSERVALLNSNDSLTIFDREGAKKYEAGQWVISC